MRCWTEVAERAGLLALAVVLGSPTASQAVVRRVKADATGAGNGATWHDAFTELQNALAVAQPGDEIWVAAGVYRPDVDLVTGGHTGDRSLSFRLKVGVGIYGGFDGTESVRSARNPLKNRTLLSGDLKGDDRAGGDQGENSLHVVVADGVDATAVLDGVVITAGNADLPSSGSDPHTERGGGMLLPTAGSNPMLVGCVFLRNRAGCQGGGLFIRGSSPELKGCVFRGNVAVNELGHGGGLCNFAGSNPRLTGCRFVDNEAGASGGGMSNLGSSPTLVNCTFTGNSAGGQPGGGAIFINQLPEDAKTFLWNCICWGNMASEGPEIVLIGGLLDVRASLIARGRDGIIPTAFTPAFDPVIGATGILSGDPRLTPDGHLRADSPCIDAGDPPPTDIGADQFLDTDGDGLPDWWERLYLPPNTSPAIDPDGDGIPNLDEYESYSSDPVAAPIHVCKGCSSVAPDGSAARPFKTIQAGIGAAEEGNTVLVRPVPEAVYADAGDVNLDFGGQSLIVRNSGPGSVTINCGGHQRVINKDSIRADFVALEGFDIINGGGNPGGALSLQHTRLRLKGCEFRDSGSSTAGAEWAALYSLEASLIVSDGVEIGVGNGHPAGLFSATNVILADPTSRLDLLGPQPTILEVDSCSFEGPGLVRLRAGTTLAMSVGNLPTEVRTAIRGSGNVLVPLGTQLVLAGETVLNLGDSDDPVGPCTSPGPPGLTGTLTATGTLILRDNARLHCCQLDVRGLRVMDASTVSHSTIHLMESSEGFGGQLLVDPLASVTCNVITSEGDRYLNLDPDPVQPRLNVSDNRYGVTIRTSPPGSTGALLELRMADDCTGDCPAGAIRRPALPGDPYSGDWALEKLEILSGGKVNLTNRQGLVFEDNSMPETLFVRTLKMHPRSVLNLGLQRLYYNKLVDGNDQPIEQEDLAIMGSPITNVPLLGFSLVCIAMNDDSEFEVRVQTQTVNPADPQSCQCEGTCTEGTLQDRSSCREGRIMRLTETAVQAEIPGLITGGVMEMRTQAPEREPASSVVAHGSFARTAEEYIQITFEYLFREGADAELIVSLTDSPEPGTADAVQAATLRPPTAGRPGAIGSSTFGVFSISCPRGSLDFTRGAYVQLELRGNASRIWIDNWDPAIKCTICGSFDKNPEVTIKDFLLLVAESGKAVLDYQNRNCLDMNKDGFCDLYDLLLWHLDQSLCVSKPAATRTVSPASASTRASSGSTRLVVGGLNRNRDLEQMCYPERLYLLDPETLCGDAVVPAGGEGSCCNGRLITDRFGQVYQVNGFRGATSLMSMGLSRLTLAGVGGATEQVLTPACQQLADGSSVRIGATVVGEVPPFDVAFHPSDPAVVYVVPVLVEPLTGTPYWAAARLKLKEGGFDVQRIYYTVSDSETEPGRKTPREIEVDRHGMYVFVTGAAVTASADLGTYDEYLFIYREPDEPDDAGQPAVLVNEVRLDSACQTVGGTTVSLGSPVIHSPTALTLSAIDDHLYVSSSVIETTTAKSCPTAYRFAVEYLPGSTDVRLSYLGQLQVSFSGREVPWFRATGDPARPDTIDLAWEFPEEPGFAGVRIHRVTTDSWPTMPSGETCGTIAGTQCIYQGNQDLALSDKPGTGQDFFYRIYALYDDETVTGGIYAAARLGDSQPLESSGPVAAITSIAEDPMDGKLWFVGYSSAAFAANHSIADPVFGETSPLFTYAGIATASPGDFAADGSISAQTVSCNSYGLALPVAAVVVHSHAADFDADWDVDGDDLSHLQSCASGPAVPFSPGDCAHADFDGDGDVDQSDFGLFQQCYSGANQPVDPQCPCSAGLTRPITAGS
ncbi:MAG TPA: right-handed parallel beta-helix repeat-containing protein [Phycisphaerae bacterium]|nr:right-handed parallel beta-helix repeat-containing protein [Phycisphaerae bacterium]HRY70325.1 right-handed parallel beta-helix repeat-containing protein [Phycisphaerae bacterium]HSA28042.1 right-handed parallel beta-helix repeat-containing protein [Phycisphaerae bacterium]